MKPPGGRGRGVDLARIELGDRAVRMLAEEHSAPVAAVRWRAVVAEVAARTGRRPRVSQPEPCPEAGP